MAVPSGPSTRNDRTGAGGGRVRKGPLWEPRSGSTARRSPRRSRCRRSSRRWS
ncbi:hypothetical protein ACFFX0_00695 [Citricoccus parietis]|uniref:Uncharacterized protein n=1 Tax=Citricoccus parietis TaxID=592307 RepID=A0ABV5FU57_9MICC